MDSTTLPFYKTHSCTTERGILMGYRVLRKVAFLSSCILIIWAIMQSVYTTDRLLFSQRHNGAISTYMTGFGWDTTSRSSSPQRDQALQAEERSPQPVTEHADYHEMIDRLPDVIRISFEEAVEDVQLQGWEDDWLSHAEYNTARWGSLSEPKIDFVYNWVNGSDHAFESEKHHYEIASPLNDPQGKWLSQHSVNRYRDWDELRYSFRSLDAHSRSFINKIQVLVNSVREEVDGEHNVSHPQKPEWLRDESEHETQVQVLTHEDFFGEVEQQCLPTYDSLSIETQIHRTPSNTDQLVGLSDDMFLGMPHAASDFYSPLFGHVMGFKHDSYNVKKLGGKDSWPTFGEKPFLHYTSWLLNRRFGERARRVQAHFTHSVSRRVTKEALASFPRPAAHGACERFRGESHFQIYPWYTSFHYSIERFREALLWSYIMSRSDRDGNGYLDWRERQQILASVQPGYKLLATQDLSEPAANSHIRERMYYRVHDELKQTGLTPPQTNVDILWTSLDGPETIHNLKCNDFGIDRCFGEGFASPTSDQFYGNPDFSSANVFHSISKQDPKCGDCLIKFLLAPQPRGLEPLLPPKATKPKDREIIIKALHKYQHTVVEPNAMFVMVKDAEQGENELIDRMLNQKKKVGQLCLNDDVMTEDPVEVQRVQDIIHRFLETMFPNKSRWEV